MQFQLGCSPSSKKNLDRTNETHFSRKKKIIRPLYTKTGHGNRLETALGTGFQLVPQTETIGLALRHRIFHPMP
jgi:hypothetical protein